MLDIRRLRLLRELHARGTLTAVARALAYSPSAVSQQLAELEREAGVPLLEPAGRGVRLTDAGHLLVEHAEVLLRELERAEADLAASSTTAVGRVRVACFQTAGVNLVPNALGRVARAHPRVRLELVQSETGPGLIALALGQIDLVVGTEYDHVPEPRDADVEREHVLRERLLLGLPCESPLARGDDPVRLADLRDASWAAGTGAGHGALVSRACNLLGGFAPDITHNTDDLVVMQALVAAGRAVTLLPELMLATLHDERVALRPVAEAALERDVFTATRVGSLRRPALAAVRDAIHAVAGELAAADRDGAP